MLFSEEGFHHEKDEDCARDRWTKIGDQKNDRTATGTAFENTRVIFDVIEDGPDSDGDEPDINRREENHSKGDDREPGPVENAGLRRRKAALEGIERRGRFGEDNVLGRGGHTSEWRASANEVCRSKKERDKAAFAFI